MITLEKLTASHQDAWAQLWTQYLAFYETERSQEIFDLTFARLIDDTHDCEAYIAFVGGDAPGDAPENAPDNAAGIVHCIYHLHLWQKEKICYLQDLFVAPPYRKHGVARQLIAQIYASADNKGAKGVYWLTQDFNAPARRLYDKIGVKTPFIKYARK